MVSSWYCLFKGIYIYIYIIYDIYSIIYKRERERERERDSLKRFLQHTSTLRSAAEFCATDSCLQHLAFKYTTWTDGPHLLGHDACKLEICSSQWTRWESVLLNGFSKAGSRRASRGGLFQSLCDLCALRRLVRAYGICSYAYLKISKTWGWHLKLSCFGNLYTYIYIYIYIHIHIHTSIYIYIYS